MSEHNLSDQDSNNPLRVPACDSCRARKIRCDRKSPCSSCRTSRATCRTTKRSPEKRQRILVSARYEREIEDVNNRLASLERILQSFANSQKQNAPITPLPSYAEDLATLRDSQRIEGGLEYEGDSSFTAHSKQVTQVFETSLACSPHPTSVHDMSAAVASLRSVLNETSNDMSNAANGSVPVHKSLENVVNYPELANLALPPMPLVLSMLRWIKTHPQRLFCDVPILDVPYITALCQKVYFPAEEYTIATFLTVHVSIFYLFRDLAEDEARELGYTCHERDETIAICRKNAEIAMRNARLCMEITYENIEAILLAGMLAMENSRSSVAWSLIATAARMVQDAGYHRLPPYSAAPEKYKKRLLFWIVYGMDRGMALNLGRSPTLQDCDITVDRPKIPEEVNGTWGALYANWLDYSQLQGHIYEQLYCGRAQRQPVEVKAELARGLVARLIKLKENLVCNMGSTPSPEALSDAMLSVEIVLDSTLTLVYRMIPPRQVSPNQLVHPLKSCDEAIETARKALLKHNEAWKILTNRTSDKWRLFIHWTHVWCPFVPYLVVFGNVIADRNVEDLRLLEHVVYALQSAAQKSSAVDKLYRACRIFCHVATVYLGHGTVPSDSGRQQQHQQPGLSEPGYPPSMLSGSSLTSDMQFDTIGHQDISMSLQEWDGMLDEWDLGLGAESAREMSSFFEGYLSGSGQPGDMHMQNPGSFA